MSELTTWIAEEFILSLTRDISAQQCRIEDAERIEQLSLENHMLAVDARRKLRHLKDALRRVRKDVQPRLF